ncbi:MAG TPA: hypothetical protein VFC06_00170 [Demequina sp.]|nr:hypothetical protein [Demequina sp.]
MAGLPGSIPSLIPAGPDEQVRRMRDVERRIDELGPSVARSFKPVLDDLTAKQATLDAQGVTLAAQVATLTDLVANMIKPEVDHAWAQNFAITTTPTDFASVTFTTPAGYTRALIAAVATGLGYNSTASTDWLYVTPWISGVSGLNEVYAGVDAGHGVSLASPWFDLLTGLTTGQVVTINVEMHTGTTWPANAGNVARIDAQVTFLR